MSTQALGTGRPPKAMKSSAKSAPPKAVGSIEAISALRTIRYAPFVNGMNWHPFVNAVAALQFDVASILTLIVVKSTITLTRLAVARSALSAMVESAARTPIDAILGWSEILGIVADVRIDPLRTDWTMSISIDTPSVGIL